MKWNLLLIIDGTITFDRRIKFSFVFFLNIGSSRLDLTVNRLPHNLEEEVLNNFAMTVNLGEAEIFNRLFNSYLETHREYVIHLDCSVDLEIFSKKSKWSKSDGMLCKSYENLKVFLFQRKSLVERNY